MRSARASQARYGMQACRRPTSKAGLRLERPQAADPAQAGCHRKQMGHARASQDRPHCLPMAREPLHQSRGGIYLCATANDVTKVAAEIGGTPYDVKNVEFGHVGDRCSFDAIVKAYGDRRRCAGPSRHHRARRRYVAARPHAARRRIARDFVRARRPISLTTTKC